MEINVDQRKYNRRMQKLARRLPAGAKLYDVDPMVFDRKLQDPAWYTWGDVRVIARIEYKGHLFTLACNGEMRIEANDRTVRYGDDLIDINVHNDDDLKKLPPEAWLNNSWFEFWTPCYQDGQVTSGDALDSIREMIDALDAWVAYCELEPTYCASAKVLS